MEKTEETQNYRLNMYPADSSSDQRLVFGCPVQGKPFDCRITFFTRKFGVIFNAFTYRDVAIKGSGLLSRLLSQTQATALTSQVCNVDPIEALLGTAFPCQHEFVAWIFRYLQFSFDHPGDISMVKEYALPSFRIASATCISRLIDLLIVAHFFEISALQDFLSRYVTTACLQLANQHFFIFTRGPSGPLRFKEINMPGLLEQTTLAIIRAARIVPANSDMWFSTAIVYRTRQQVLDFANGAQHVSQQLLRLSSVSAFASAWVKATCALRPVVLDGVFPQSPNWALQHTRCGCSACTKDVWRKDLVERSAAEVAAGVVQKYALVNPFDGYMTVFCDYCLRNCGVPWGTGNKPCDPHE